MTRLLAPAALGIGIALVTVGLLFGVGRVLGREPAIPWSCDDTRYVDTAPVGRGVVGPALAAPPGCGGQGG